MAHKPISPVTYGFIYVLLLLLTALTVYLATQGHLGVWEIPVALGIATAKTVLVGLYFMHLIHSNRLTILIVLAGVLFLVIMVMLTLTDYWTRSWLTSPQVSGAPSITQPLRAGHGSSGDGRS